MSPHILVCLMAVVIGSTSSLSPKGVQLQQVLEQQLQSYAAQLEDSALHMHDRYHRSRELPRHRRIKRSPEDYRHAFVTGSGVGNREELRVDSLTAVNGTAMPVAVSVWKYFLLGDIEYLATIQPANEKVEIFQIDLEADTPLTSIFNYTVNASDIEVLHLKRLKRAGMTKIQESFIAVSDAEGVILLNAGTAMFKVNQTLALTGVTDLAGFQMNSLSYLAIARAHDNSSIDIKSHIYKWSATSSRFVFSQEVTTFGAIKVAPFTIGNNNYLAFAQKYSQSFVCRFDKKLGIFKVYQRLVADGTSDVSYFSTAYWHFIAFIVPTRNVTVFYQWKSRIFIQFQELPTRHGNSWELLKVPNCQDGTILVLSSHLPPPYTLKMYHFSSTQSQFEQMNISHLLDFDESVLGASSVVMIYQFGEPLHIAVAFEKTSTGMNNQADILRVMASSHPVVDAYQQEVEQLQKDLDHIVGVIDNYEAALNDTRIHLSNSVLINNEDVQFDGFHRAQNVIHNGTITATYVDVRGETVLPTPDGGDEKLNELEAKLDNITKYLANVSRALNNSVSLDTKQTIIGHKQFPNATIESSLVTNNLTSDVINGENIQRLDSEAVRLNGTSQFVQGPVTFRLDVNMTSDLNVTGLINGLDLEEDVVLTDKNQTVTGDKLIDNSVIVTMNVNVTDGIRINGLDISEELVQLTGNHTLSGDIRFEESMNISGDIITSGLVDGVNLTKLVPDVMTIIGNQTILGNMTMLSLAKFNTDVNVTGYVNGEDLSDVDQQAVKINEDTQISGVKILQGPVLAEGNILVNGTVDELEWPEDILTIAENNTVTGGKEFVGNVNITYAINVTGRVDGLDLSQDVVTLSGNHSVNGLKNFSNGIGVTGDVRVNRTSTVDGVDVSELELNVVTQSADQTIQGDAVFTDPVKFLGNLTAAGLVNNIDLGFLYDDAVFKDIDTVQEITGNNTFAEPVTVQSGVLNIFALVNGYNMTQDFLNKINDQYVNAVKNFVDGFSVQSNITVNGLIEGIDLNRLYQEAILTWRDATITGNKTFLSGLDIEGSLVMMDNKTVAGLDVSDDFMMTNQNQTVRGNNYFDRIEVLETLSASNLTVTETLNGRNWTEFLINRVTLTTDQVLDGNYTIANSTHIAGNVTVSGTLNGLNLTRLAGNVMLKSIEQTVTGENTFAGMVTVLGNITCGLLDGVDITNLNNRAMFVDKDQNITGNKTFWENVDIDGDLYLEGLLNGIDIIWLIQDAVFNTSEPQNILSVKIFLDGFEVNRDVNVTGLVNNIDLSEEMLTVSTPQQVFGLYTFVGNVTVHANFEVTSINGVHIKEFNATVMKINIPQVVSSELLFLQDVYVENDLPVWGFVDGVNLTDLNLTTVMLDQPFIIYGDLSFTTPVMFLDDINATGLIHGLDFAKWTSEVVTIDTEQTIPNFRIFTDVVRSTAGMMVNGNISASSVFGEDLEELLSDAVFLQGNQTITGYKTVTGTLTVIGDIFVAGTVDGVKVATDVVTLDGDQEVSGVKTYMKRIIVRGDIVISGLVNGVDIDVVEADTFKINDPEDILAKKTFQMTLTVHGNMSVGEVVDGIDLDQEAVTLHTDQMVIGPKTFVDGMIIIGGHVYVSTGNVCNTSLSDLDIERVSLSGNETLNGTLTFTGHTTFEDDVSINNLVNGVDLEHLEYWEEKVTAYQESTSRGLFWIIDQLCMAIDTLQTKYQSVYADLLHVSEVQTMLEHAQSFEAFTIDGVSYLAMARMSNGHSDACIDSIIYQWNQTLEQFVEKERLPTRGARKWHSFWMNSVLYLAIANSMTNPCGGDTVVSNTIYYYNGSHFEHFQELVGGGSNEIETASVDNKTFLAVANFNSKLSAGNSSVYLYSEATERFEQIQNISVGDASAVEFCTVGSLMFLVFTHSEADMVSVYIYEPEVELFILNQTLDASVAVDVTCYEFRGQTGLIIANHGYRMQDDVAIDFDGDLVVYYWSVTVGAFVFSTSIPIEAPVNVRAFLVADYLYVAAVSLYSKFELFKYQGTVNFLNVLSQEWTGIVSVEVFKMDHYNDHLYFAVSVDPLNPDENVYSMLLDGIMIGEIVAPVDGICEENLATPVYQQPVT